MHNNCQLGRPLPARLCCAGVGKVLHALRACMAAGAAARTLLAPELLLSHSLCLHSSSSWCCSPRIPHAVVRSNVSVSITYISDTNQSPQTCIDTRQIVLGHNSKVRSVKPQSARQITHTKK